MNKINLKALIEEKNLDFNTLAALLFPGNLLPIKALERIADGRAELKESQIQTLSDITGLEPSDLFKNAWKGSLIEKGLMFKRGNITAYFYPFSGVTKVWGNDDLLLTEFVVLGESVTVKSYLKRLDLEVNKSIKSL